MGATKPLTTAAICCLALVAAQAAPALPPSVSITSGPTGLSNAAAVRFTFGAPDAAASFECRVDEGQYTPCASSFDVLGSLPDGPHVFDVRATGATGESSVASATWVVDRTPPPAKITRGPTNGTISGAAELQFSSEFEATFQCMLDAGPFVSCTSPVVYRGLTRGIDHTFVVKATDAAGNESAPAVRHWTIDVVVSIAGVAEKSTKAFRAQPAQGTVVKAAPVLRWAKVAGATYFNVQVWRGPRKVLSAWPNVPRLRLRSSWAFDGATLRLDPGTYTWFVWPGLGDRKKARYGHLVGSSTFVVARVGRSRL
jgi:hypothetical protein